MKRRLKIKSLQNPKNKKMDELEELKRKRLQEIIQKQQEQNEEHAQFEQQLDALEDIIKQKLTKKAMERYFNLKVAHPEKAVQLLVLVANAIQGSKIKEITDEQLKDLLKRMEQGKKEFKVMRK